MNARTPATAFALAVCLGLGLAGCSSSDSTTTATATSAPATTAAPAADPATTTKASSSGSSGTTEASGSAASSSSTEGACGLLTLDEIKDATGVMPDEASPVRGGCRFETGVSDPVVDIEVDTPSGDPIAAFATEKTLYDSGNGSEGIGEDSFTTALDAKVVFLKDGKIYSVWVQDATATDRAERTQIAIKLANLVDDRL